jgi:proton-coupled amino acid transporter
MHSVGVMTQEERIAGDGTLHLMSISRRKKGTEPTYKDLMDLFHQKPLEPLETVRETEDDEYEEVVLDSVEGGSLTAAIFGIVKGTVGPAVLYLPRGFALSGYAVAIPAMIIATISYLYSATRLLQCWKVESDKNRALAQKMEELRGLLDPEGAEIESKKQYGSTSADLHCPPLENAGHLLTYPELARRAFGKASVLISGGIAAMQFGVCLTYLIFVPQNLFESTRALFGVEIRREIFLAGMLVLEIPLVWIRDIRKLTPFNILATIFIAFGLVSVLFIALFGLDHPATAYQVANEGEMYQLYEEVTHLSAINPTWFLFIGTSFFCFEGSITLLVPLQEAVYKKEDRENFLNVNRRVTSSIVAFYIVFATICW